MTLLCDRLKAAMDAATPEIKAIELARQIGVTRATVSEWLSGKTKEMKGSLLVEVAAVLQVSSYWLGTGKGTMRLTEVNDAHQNYNTPSINEEKLRQASRFLFDHIDINDAFAFGSEWIASAIIIIYNIKIDPEANQLSDETIIKILMSLKK
jgi:transcriptional regulator with XRE-family HTH domain